MKGSKERFGYATGPEPESLQEQVEALDDAQIPIDHQYAEIVNPSHPNRLKFDALLKRARPGDTIVIAKLSALGFDPLDVCDRIKKIEEKSLRLKILDLADWKSQTAMLDALQYFNDIFRSQKELIPITGRPHNAYPPGWRDAYRKYMSGESSGPEICSSLGISSYDFYRMVNRYKTALKSRRKKKKSNSR